MNRKIARLGATMAIAGALVAGPLALSPASAQVQGANPGGDVHILADHEMYTSDQSWPYDPAGHMWFNEAGDVVTLCDNDADGQKVYLEVTSSKGSYGMAVGGEGNCVTHRAKDGGIYNLPESGITFEISASGDPVGSYNRASWINDH